MAEKQDEGSVLELAQAAASEDEEFGRRWLARRKPATFEELDALEALLYVSVDDGKVEKTLDEALAGPPAPRVVDALARADVAWSNPHLLPLLDDSATRQAAAFVLLAGESEGLKAWLEESDDGAGALDIFRAAGLSGAGDFREIAGEWHEAFVEAEELRASRSLGASMAVLDPRAYARQIVLGELELDWLTNSTCVADFLQAHGPTDWLETLAWLEGAGAKGPLEFASLIAVAASFDDRLDEDEEAAIERLMQAAEHVEEPYKVADVFGFQIALGEDDDLIVLLAEASLHERARRLQLPSAGISGLVLSGTDVESLPRLEKVESFFSQMGRRGELSDEDIVALVRTLSDLGAWLVKERELFLDLATRVARRLKRHEHKAVRMAVERLEAMIDGRPGDVQKLGVTAESEKLIGLDAVRQLVDLGSEEALEEIARLWTTGPIIRAWFYRDALISS